MVKRKLRLWVCPCCRRAYNRTMKESYMECSYCKGVSCRKARTYPSSRKTLCKHERAKKQKSRFKETYYTKVRKSNGRVFYRDPDARKAWDEVRKAKQRPTLARRAEKWFQEIYRISQEGVEDSMPKEVTVDGEVVESRHYYHLPPELLFVDRPYIHRSVLGEYRRKYGRRKITVALRQDLDYVRETIIHEVLHMLDSMANIDDERHGKYWKMRLDKFRKMFPITGKK